MFRLIPTALRSLSLAAFVALVAPACNGGSPGEGEPCPATRCSRHGTCTEKNFLPACECEPGYLGLICGECAPGFHRSGFTECVADEICVDARCGLNGTCSVVGGITTCACDTGFGGANCEACVPGYHLTAAGTCAVDETCLPTSCANGVCDDSTGVVACTCDAPDNGPTCRGSCEGAENPCVHGTCALERGYARCTCDAGYTGADCATCVAGYHARDDGTCALDEPCTAVSCSGAGTCSARTGRPACTCLEGYTGTACDTCAEGFHRDTGYRCVADTRCESLSCSAGATCVASGGEARCVCRTGYAGADCGRCYPGYHRDGTGACVLDERCTDTSCGASGTCEDATGVVRCTCPSGLSGTHCEINLDDCGTACGGGTCIDLVGERVCLCTDGRWGQSCAPGPVVGSFSPATLTQLGGVVTLTGSNFGNGATITVGGVAAANVQWLSPTQLRATFPRLDTTGVQPVAVQNPGGVIGLSEIHYTPTVFSHTGALQTFTVPEGVTALHVRAWGAGGGAGAGSSVGGGGGFASGTVAVTAGQVLTIVVGQGGARVNLATPAGAGGGLSGLFSGEPSQATALVLAGGGGGAGGSDASPGGNGGGEYGASGAAVGDPNVEDGRGFGGGPDAGGIGGCASGNTNCGGHGTALLGGGGGIPTLAFARTGATYGGGGAAGDSDTTGAGGGGGGYFGGGGGANGVAKGGGGGAGFIAAGGVQSGLLLRGATPGLPGGENDTDRPNARARGGSTSDGGNGTGGDGHVLLHW